MSYNSENYNTYLNKVNNKRKHYDLNVTIANIALIFFQTLFAAILISTSYETSLTFGQLWAILYVSDVITSVSVNELFIKKRIYKVNDTINDVLLEKIQNNEIDVDSALFINDISYSLHKPFGIMRYVLQLIYDVTILSIILFYGAGVSLEHSIFIAVFANNFYLIIWLMIKMLSKNSEEASVLKINIKHLANDSVLDYTDVYKDIAKRINQDKNVNAELFNKIIELLCRLKLNK
jgi:hypothetical protein